MPRAAVDVCGPDGVGEGEGLSLTEPRSSAGVSLQLELAGLQYSFLPAQGGGRYSHTVQATLDSFSPSDTGDCERVGGAEGVFFHHDGRCQFDSLMLAAW